MPVPFFFFNIHTVLIFKKKKKNSFTLLKIELKTYPSLSSILPPISECLEWQSFFLTKKLICMDGEE